MTKDHGQPTYRAMKRMMRMMAVAPLLIAGGCVNVSAPDKPIEINLNIRVTQEVIYRLADSTKTLIQDNPGIF